MRIRLRDHVSSFSWVFLLLLVATAANAASTEKENENRPFKTILSSQQESNQEDVFSLRASHLFHDGDTVGGVRQERQSPVVTRQHDNDRELIIDKDALEDLEEVGVDPTAPEAIFHPPGHEANLWEYPFFAHWSHAMCGATVIHDDILLTAGHCGRKATEPHWRKHVQLLSKYRKASNNKKKTGQEGVTRKIAHLEVHPEFYQPKQIYDFQLIKVSKSVLVDGNGDATGVQVVKLNTRADNPAPGDPIQAVGFGTVTPDGSTGNSQVLMDVTLQAFDNAHCKKQYGSVINGDVMVCIGSLDGSQDTCQGDSGGPMLDSTHTQIGVISWGEGCARADRTGLASRLSAVTDWIESGICRLSAMPPASCHTNTTTSYNSRLPENEKTPLGQDTFDIRVTVLHDSAPGETAWSLTHVDSHSLLYLQDFESVPAPFVDVSHVFHGLKAGKYAFAISDTKQDGLCCEFGQGNVAITHHETNEVLWEHNGDFTDFVGVTLELDSSGSLISAEETTSWKNPSVQVTEDNDAKHGHMMTAIEEEQEQETPT